MRLAVILLTLTASPLIAQEAEHRHEGPVPERLGKVEFPVSCSAEAQKTFTRGLALLHSFWYAEAEKTFARAAEEDPRCAMAHWGVAMSLFHPVWAAANPAAAPTPAELGRGKAAVATAKALGARTERERDYIAAVEAFYREPEGGSYEARAAAFEASMETVHRRHPEDKEAGIFYALALLGTAPPSDKTYAKQKKAAELLNAVLPESPEHPGVAHYLIHSFDYPELAPLALDAARAYAKIAPDAPHALHMPSHIFVRLGLWEDAIRSNTASAEAAHRCVATTKPGAHSFDELHAFDYLVYAYLQGAQDGKAHEVVDEVAKVDALDAPAFQAGYALAAVPARYALERRDWKEAAALTVRPASFPWARFPYAEAIIHHARAIGAARAGQLDVAREAIARLETTRKSLAASGDTYWAQQLDIQCREAAAWLARAEGRDEEAVSLLRSAADMEDASEKHPVTPGPVLPAREMLGDLLLELKRPAEAMAAYEAVLKTGPGRFLSTLGAARAAELAGDRERARTHYAELDKLAIHADPRPELVSLRRSGPTGN
jgi:hypothetical protein